MSQFHYDYPYIDNDTFYHIPASFASIEEAFARIRENDIIFAHCGGLEDNQSLKKERIRRRKTIRKYNMGVLNLYINESIKFKISPDRVKKIMKKKHVYL